MSFWSRFKKKKTNTTASNQSGYYYSVTMSTMPSKLEPIGKCECCGRDIYTKTYACDICGKNTCESCMMLLTSVAHIFSFSAGTVATPVLVPNPAPQTKPSNLHMCVNCADLLKLSLRIASAYGYDVKRGDVSEG